MTLLAKGLDKLPLETVQPLFNDGLNYVWTHLEHYMDTVRHMTKSVFKGFIHLAHTHKQLGKKERKNAGQAIFVCFFLLQQKLKNCTLVCFIACKKKTVTKAKYTIRK